MPLLARAWGHCEKLEAFDEKARTGWAATQPGAQCFCHGEDEDRTWRKIHMVGDPFEISSPSGEIKAHWTPVTDTCLLPWLALVSGGGATSRSPYRSAPKQQSANY